MPQRLQRCRKKGAHLPPGTVCVTQETIWGNEHNWKVLGRTEAVRRFRADAEKREREDPQGYAAWLAPLRGKNLACYCPLGEPCHADVLLELANREAAA